MGKIRHFGVLANSIGQPHKRYKTKVLARETREGWPLLNVETEVNKDSKSTNDNGPSLACCAGTRDFCFALAALVGPVQNIFFRTVHFFNAFVPIAQQAGH
jgi:hypothetical protein